MKNFVIIFSWNVRGTSAPRNFRARILHNKNNKYNDQEFQIEGTQVNDLWTGLACDPAVLDASKCRGIDAAAATFIRFPRGLTTLLRTSKTQIRQDVGQQSSLDGREREKKTREKK